MKKKEVIESFYAKEMDNKVKIAFYFSIMFFLILLIIFAFQRSQWFLDASSDLILIIILFLFRKKLYLFPREFYMILSAIFLSILGAVNAYNWHMGNFQFDNLLHFYAAFVSSWAIFNFFSHHFRFEFKRGFKLNIPLLLLIIVSILAMFGVLVEVVEYIGFSCFGDGQGIFFTGAGDGQGIMLYIDTMQDLVVNLCGAVLGVTFYYFFVFKKMLRLNFQKL